MSTIKNILQILGYSEVRITAVGKLLLMVNTSKLNAFQNIVDLQKTNIDQRKKNWLNLISELDISEKTIPEKWLINTEKLWQNEGLISDVLNYEFNLSHYQLFKFLVALTQLQFILGSRFEVFSGITNMYELDNKQTVSFAIKKLVKDLEFSNQRKYLEEDGEVKTIFLHAATEKALAIRFGIVKEIASKQKKPLEVYYTTNPRGLSKTEASTADILATWFTSDHILQEKIANHIKDIFSRKDLNFDWFKGLNNLRNIILESVNQAFELQLQEFPSAPNSEVYPAIYDETAALDGNRDPLNNKWPHVGHLVDYLASKAGLTLNNVHIKIIPVAGVTLNGKYRPAQTKELIEAFFIQENNALTERNNIYAVSDNSVSYGGVRQDVTLTILAKAFNKQSTSIITYFDAIDVEQIDFERITKEVAAQFHTYYELDSDLETRLENSKQYQKTYF